MDKLVEVQFDYASLHGDWKNILTKSQVDLLQSVCSKPVKCEQMTKRNLEKEDLFLFNDEDKTHEDNQVMEDAYNIGSHTNIVSLNSLLALDLPISFKITCQIKETPEYNVEENILHKLVKLESQLDQFDQAAQFNTKVGVHISDLGLLNVRNVTWLEDTCTEELQRHLDDGWRILAVCPQPNSRRPDYILGRNDNKEE